MGVKGSQLQAEAKSRSISVSPKTSNGLDQSSHTNGM
jgi:hypothetical protein